MLSFHFLPFNSLYRYNLYPLSEMEIFQQECTLWKVVSVSIDFYQISGIDSVFFHQNMGGSIADGSFQYGQWNKFPKIGCLIQTVINEVKIEWW